MAQRNILYWLADAKNAHSGNSIAVKCRVPCEDVVAWARSAHGPVSSAVDGPTTCYDCGNELSFVASYKRHRNGIEQTVRSFYRHTRTGGAACCAETISHLAAKHALVEHATKWWFYFMCPRCENQVPVTIPHSASHQYSQEVVWREYRLDVGVLDGGDVVGAIEVMVTHACTPEKVQALCEHDIAWCEVTAERVLKATESACFNVRVARCAVVMCDACVLKLCKDATAELDKRLMSVQGDAERLVQKQQQVIRDAQAMWRAMTPAPRQDQQQRAWAILSKHVLQAAAEKACELGMCPDLAVNHAERVLAGELVLDFGKHKGRLLEDVKTTDWTYLLWLAGYDFGRMDDSGRAGKRDPNYFIPTHVQAKALEMVRGVCFACRAPTGQEEWKTWCGSCYKKVRKHT